jgi:hypothetical protein
MRFEQDFSQRDPDQAAQLVGLIDDRDRRWRRRHSRTHDFCATPEKSLPQR